MNVPTDHPTLDDAIQRCFRSPVSFVPHPEGVASSAATVRFATLPADETEPPGLENDELPYLALPDDTMAGPGEGGCLALVAVEGRDRLMADAVAPLLDPNTVSIGLMHVTWMPRTIASPLPEGGLDNPEPGELLVYQGAREALVDTAGGLRAAGFDVSTHLREDRDPSRPLAETIARQGPDLFVLGLGRHGAGIGRRVLEATRIPMLYVRAR